MVLHQVPTVEYSATQGNTTRITNVKYGGEVTNTLVKFSATGSCLERQLTVLLQKKSVEIKQFRGTVKTHKERNIYKKGFVGFIWRRYCGSCRS